MGFGARVWISYEMTRQSAVQAEASGLDVEVEAAKEFTKKLSVEGSGSYSDENTQSRGSEVAFKSSKTSVIGFDARQSDIGNINWRHATYKSAVPIRFGLRGSIDTVLHHSRSEWQQSLDQLQL